MQPARRAEEEPGIGESGFSPATMQPARRAEEEPGNRAIRL
jgi:hypothetical protein